MLEDVCWKRDTLKAVPSSRGRAILLDEQRRAVRVATDLGAALFFRRGIAELGTLGHPPRLDE